jgi:hypothetical protein
MLAVATDFRPSELRERHVSSSVTANSFLSPGLGADFLAAVDETTRRIGRFPVAAPIDCGGVRKRCEDRLVRGGIFHALEFRLFPSLSQMGLEQKKIALKSVP